MVVLGKEAMKHVGLVGWERRGKVVFSKENSTNKKKKRMDGLPSNSGDGRR